MLNRLKRYKCMTGNNNTKENTNPTGIDGFEFIEFSSPNPEELTSLFALLGFKKISYNHKYKTTRFKQGDINFLVTEKPNSFSSTFHNLHGPSACSFAMRVKDTNKALNHLSKQGATVIKNTAKDGLPWDAIEGVGGSRLYIIDKYADQGSLYSDFEPIEDDTTYATNHLFHIDHITHNVERGKMDTWAGFYEKLFNFKEIRYFDISGEYTGLFSRAMQSPCGKVSIPINESSDDKSQIAEYLEQYKGEGIQHIALSTKDIYKTIEELKSNGVPFLTPPPDLYYKNLEFRLPNHGENVKRMQKNGILLDGKNSNRMLLQIFTEASIGPIFFEIIQRKGDDGFGEGNFKALFESMERDQIKRGVLEQD